MLINSQGVRGLLLFLLLASTCFTVIYGKGGRGGGGRGGSRGSSSRSTSRQTSTRYRATSRPAPAPAPTYRPAPAPAPTYRPAAAPATRRPVSAVTSRPAAPNEPVVKQPASNPNFKETNTNQQQPAYNPNYKPDGSPPGGAPPPYSPAGQAPPRTPGGAPPPYQQNPPPGHGIPGQPPYAPGGGQPPPYPGGASGGFPVPPPGYPGLPGRPGGYPNQPGGYPNQAGGYPNQPGGYPNQPGGYPNQPGGNRPYPVQPGGYPAGGYPNQPGGYPNQAGGNRPYPVQPGGYPGSYPGGNRPYPVQPGSYPQQGGVWNPQSGRPAPPYMNYGGLPTGGNMYSKPIKQKGFLGSLLSGGGKNKAAKYGMLGGGAAAAGYGMGKMGGKMGGVGGFLGRHKSAAMYAILPVMAYKAGSMMSRPRFRMPFFMPMGYYHHHHYGHYGSEYTHYYDVRSDDYVGKCQQPLKRDHAEMKCKSTHKEIECQTKCEEGYKFENQLEVQSTKCWHVTGVWRPYKNFPPCNPICEEECENGGQCIRPGVCECPEEYRGSSCQFRKLDFSKCDIRNITKGELNAGFVCTHAKNETTCQVRCKEPTVFETPFKEDFRCKAEEGKWTPESMPRCVPKDAPKPEKLTAGEP